MAVASRVPVERPGPLQRIAGRTMIHHVLDAVTGAAGPGPAAERIVVVAPADDHELVAELHDTKQITDVVVHDRDRGTASALLAALTAVVDDPGDDSADVLVVPADVPLVRPSTLAELVAAHRDADAAVTILASRDAEPGGRPRLVRGGRDHRVVQVVGPAELLDHEADLDEVATGIWCFRRCLLAPALRRVDGDGMTRAADLSGVVGVLARTGNRVEVRHGSAPDELRRVTDRVALAEVGAELRRRINLSWLERGVTLVDADRVHIDATVELAPDVVVLPDTILEGATIVADGCELGPGTRLIDCVVGARCRIESTRAEGATIGPDCVVGPYAVLGPGSRLAGATVTGPFYAAPDDSRPGR